MNKMVITQYVHRPNATELGQGNTHETYLLVKRDIDLSDLFPPSENVEVQDSHGKIYTLKSAVGSEFRINQMGPIYRDYNVMPGDEIVFTQLKTDASSELKLNVRTYNRAVIIKTNKGAEIINAERINLSDDKEVSLPISYDGKSAEIKIKFLSLENKRSDSPEKTKFYDVRVDGSELPKCNQNESFYLTSQDGVSTLAAMSKSEYNRVILTDDIDNVLIEPNRETSKSLQRIYYGAPGTGKSHAIKDETKGEKTIRITFHPDTDYASFVGAYKPTMKKVDVQVVPVVLSTGASFEQNKGTFSEERISYEYVMQAFLQAYVAAWEYQQDENPKPVYLIIEEINRGNCAQIFGDIFQLLDRNDNGFSDYPINADQDLQTHLCKKLSAINIANEDSINSLFEGEKSIVDDIKSGKVLVLPNNLYIWATMNTSDQSLFPIDSAFKRRWDWNYVPILDAHKGWKINVRGTNYDWWDFLTRINDSIGSTTQSEDKKLGYFFCKTVNGVISAETFVSKVIFYLWNDVFKDFGLGDPLFKDDDGKELSFNKFYMVDERGKAIVNADKVALFLNNLGVKQIGSESSNTEQDEDNAMSPEDGGSSSDYSKYSVNGSGRYGKCAAPFEAIKTYCNAHPNMTDSQIVDAWLALDVEMPNLIETEAQYKERVQGSKDSKLSTKSKTLKLNSGSTIYVSNQFNPERISDFVTKVNSSDLGIRLAKID